MGVIKMSNMDNIIEHSEDLEVYDSSKSKEETYKDAVHNYRKEQAKEAIGKTKSTFGKFINFIAPPKSKEQIEYEKQLIAAKLKARREATLKATIAQESKMAALKVRKQYQPKQWQSPASVSPIWTGNIKKKGKTKPLIHNDFNRILWNS